MSKDSSFEATRVVIEIAAHVRRDEGQVRPFSLAPTIGSDRAIA